MEQTTEKIYLANERRLTETNAVKIYSTFNFEKYNNEYKKALETLFLWNDQFISGGKTTFFLSKQDSYQLFFPITGSLDIVQEGKEFSVNTGQVQVINAGKGEVLELTNPYTKDTINYLQIGISTDMFLLRASEMLFNFNFDQAKNSLIEIISNAKLPFKISAGRFDGSEGVIYSPQHSRNNVFCFVVDGKLEVEGTLLQDRDGLAFQNLPKLEMRCKSNNACIIMLELLPLF